MALRSRAVFARHAGHARSAASIARRVSLAPITGTVPMRCPLAGLWISSVAFESASAHAPSI
jgi:hypothetical protein